MNDFNKHFIAVHDDVGTSISEGVKDSNEHFIVYFHYIENLDD